jgi:hypothetical protein
MTLEDAYHYMWREEITDWDTPNHIYVTKGAELVAYVPQNTRILRVFNTPMKRWSVSRRKFRKLGKREIASYIEKL